MRSRMGILSNMTASYVPTRVFIHADDAHPFEPGRNVNLSVLALGEETCVLWHNAGSG